VTARGSVTHWVGLLKAGDHAAAQPLWEAYCRRLAGLARKKLGDSPRRAADEEDVALSAFDSLCRGAAQGRFPLLRDRDDLWHLLVVLTARKAWRQAKHEAREKRGGGRVLAAADLAAGDTSSDEGLAQAIGQEPAPDFAAQVAEECRLLLDRLGDAELRSIALWKMEGYANEEIAGRLGCAPRTVERKLRRIRVLWSEEAQP
jgi:DNA-directed RNA polymerase specialized sigma24 family protein